MVSGERCVDLLYYWPFAIRHSLFFSGEVSMRKAHLLTTAALAAVLTAAGVEAAGAQARTTLDIYVVDVEGGNATLFVPPSGEPVLIDSGNVAPAAVRDAERIMA